MPSSINTPIKSLLRKSAGTCLAALLLLSLAPTAHAVPVGGIYKWNTHRLIPGTAGIIPGPDTDLSDLNLNFADLTNLDLAGADFTNTTFNNARFRDSDLRGAIAWKPEHWANKQNVIGPTGIINGLNLTKTDTLTIRNNALPITVITSATADKKSTLQFILEDNFTSTLTFAPKLNPSLKGKLNLILDPNIDAETLVGHSFDLFNWTKNVPASRQFASVTTANGLTWDLSNLYTTGIVTLTAAPSNGGAVSSVPEPASLTLLALGATALLTRRRRRA